SPRRRPASCGYSSPPSSRRCSRGSSVGSSRGEGPRNETKLGQIGAALALLLFVRYALRAREWASRSLGQVTLNRSEADAEPSCGAGAIASLQCQNGVEHLLDDCVERLIQRNLNYWLPRSFSAR